MCTPSFMCKFPFSGGDSLPVAAGVPRLGRAPSRAIRSHRGGAQPMRKHPPPLSTSSVERLRLAIDCMPVATREAMLDGVWAGTSGSSSAPTSTSEGGVCPMLAAHRRGGRTDFLSFARSWDRFTRAGKRKRAATARELAHPDRPAGGQPRERFAGSELDRAIAEHRHAGRRAACARALLAASGDLGEEAADPRGEISARAGLRPATEHLAGSDEHDLRDDARGGDLQQVAHGLGDVLGPDHLLGGDVLLDEVGHRRVHEGGAQRR